jgi:chorismate mutase
VIGVLAALADLNSAFPARAARALGGTDVPRLGAMEIEKPGAPPRGIRVLLLWNTSRRQDEIVHVHLGGADVMRARSAALLGVPGTRGGSGA